MTAHPTPITCPCCGASADAPSSVEGLVRSLPPTVAAILRRLSQAPGEWVMTDDLVFAVWGGRWHEPGHPRNVIRVVISKARPRIEAAGYRVEGRKGSHGGYRLVALAKRPAEGASA